MGEPQKPVSSNRRRFLKWSGAALASTGLPLFHFRLADASVTQISDAHFLYEAKYNGSELVVIDPQYSATSTHADQWLPIQSGTDAALALATARHIIDTNRVDWTYVKEQTDLPMLVRQDSGEFLRGSHLEKDGENTQLYMWDSKADRVYAAPGCEGGDNPKLTLEIEPALEGSFTVTLV